MATLRGSSGGGYERRGRFYIRITVAPREPRRSEHAPWAKSLEEVVARGRAVQALVNRLLEAGKTDFIARMVEIGAVADDAKMMELSKFVDDVAGGQIVKDEKPSAVVTFKKFADRWTSGELHRLYPDHVPLKKTSDEDAGRLEKWIYPVVQDVPLASFGLDHALEVMRRLPRTLSPATRRHVGQLLVRVLGLAVYPTRTILVSPLPRGFLPKKGSDKAFSDLYPAEDGTLLAASRVPLVHRLLYGFLCREGMRSEEAQSLQWSDLDLVRGAVRLDINKTDDPRSWTLGADVTRALRIWRTMQNDDLVFGGLTTPYRLAEIFRKHLKDAGVKRAELFTSTPTRRRIRIHDCRATFVTLSLTTGKTEAWVTDRTGHGDSAMLNKYRRAARMVEELGLGWLAPLDEAIPELAASKVAAEVAATPARPVSGGGARRLKTRRFRRVDSNHRKRNQKAIESLADTESRDVAAPLDAGGASSEGPPPVPAASSGDSAAKSDSPAYPSVGDGVEEALRAASFAGRWDLVAALARELEARRLASSSNVVAIDRAKRR